MSSHTVFVPKSNSPAILANQFHWKFGSNPEVTADRSLFYLHEFPPTGERNWSISGSTGSILDSDYFAYNMTIPYINDAPLKATYTLKDKLSFKHSHSIPAPDGFNGWTVVDADEATLIIDLDPAKGIAVGTFEANFKSHGYRTQPIGRFNLVIS
ncbi:MULTISPECIES: hypothetical protein [unclassified Pseudomonas]|uniref:hypothetical protein n=1 Tax=unclassified Pseudomonas TaxID=196821 RepID=UPI000A1DC562|nr:MULTISPECIES: hypothetical protein [unclassified Pseudomonas]